METRKYTLNRKITGGMSTLSEFVLVMMKARGVLKPWHTVTTVKMVWKFVWPEFLIHMAQECTLLMEEWLVISSTKLCKRNPSTFTEMENKLVLSSMFTTLSLDLSI
eukprot:Lithocolla_globosa_v1_NODE_2801_length_1864_cov_5.329464.p3 type:complete len:107 gc:universal NODE_2801_length_1864_cov_5.329464:894-1214(+)